MHQQDPRTTTLEFVRPSSSLFHNLFFRSLVRSSVRFISSLFQFRSLLDFRFRFHDLAMRFYFSELKFELSYFFPWVYFIWFHFRSV
jgi:hypothetical protein